jgi:hypothetical protein
MLVKALVDCGATGDFIDSEYVISHNLPVRPLLQPIPVLNVDGSPNQAGGITGVVDVVVDYKGHSERLQLAITQLGKQHVILGYSWLQKHNPEIDWETKEVRMTRCPTGCRTCRDELRAVWRNEKLAASILRQLREGPTLSICAIDSEEWHRDNGYDLANDDDLPELCPDSIFVKLKHSRRRSTSFGQAARRKGSAMKRSSLCTGVITLLKFLSCGEK